MAKFNEILTGRLNRYLQKTLQMKGGPPSAQLATEIGAQMVIPDFGVESKIFLSWDRYVTSLIAGPTGGLTSNTKLRNPAGSKMVAVIERITVSSTVPIVFTIGKGVDANLTNVFLSVVMDKRNTRANSPITPSAFVGVAAATTTETFALAANTPFQVILTDDQEFTLLPGDNWQIDTVTVNVQFFVSFQWRERALEESEVQV